MAHVNVALAALRALHPPTPTENRRELARSTVEALPPQHVMQPLPPSSIVHMCVVCFKTRGVHTPGRWVTTIGHVLCDEHKDEHSDASEVKRLLNS